MLPGSRGFKWGSLRSNIGGSSFDSGSFDSSSFGSRSSSSRPIASNSSATGRGLGSAAKPPQPELQAWLQERGVAAAEADSHARDLGRAFRSQQAALAALPATFEWCQKQGLTGPQTARVLCRMAFKRHDSVVEFTSMTQHDWLLIDRYIAAYVEKLQQKGDNRLRRRTCLADVLRGSADAAQALGMPPGHVAAWLAAVGDQLPTDVIGRLLLGQPKVVNGRPGTALAALAWAASELGVSDQGDFFATATSLLTYEVVTLQRNLDSLQQALGWPTEQAQQLVLKQPLVLAASQATVHAAVAWLQQHFPDAEQLADIVSRGPQLLGSPTDRLQRNADALQRALGWRDGDGQLARFVAAYPSAFADVDFSSDDLAHKLLFLTQVVGLSAEQCLSKGSGYLKTGQRTMCAVYVLLLVSGVHAWRAILCHSGHCAEINHPPSPWQRRAPQLLRDKHGRLHLAWIWSTMKPHYLDQLGIDRATYNVHVKAWPDSQEGQRLLGELRCGLAAALPCRMAPHCGLPCSCAPRLQLCVPC